MDTKNETLYEEALEAIKKLFSDTSVSKEKTAENIAGLIDELEIMQDSLRSG